MVKNRTWPFIEAACAKRVELTAARRQNAAVQLQAVFLKARDSALCSCTSRSRVAMATLRLAPDGCNGLFCGTTSSQPRDLTL
jgi:hypothetical protein